MRYLIMILMLASYAQQKGIAMVTNNLADLDAVGADWFYNWTTYPTASADIRNVPMSREGLFDTNLLPSDYAGYMLVFNEPNNVEPFGANLTPQVAAVRYITIRAAYPNAVMVVGNCSAWATDWYSGFVNALNAAGEPIPTHWGIHGYIEAWITTPQLVTWWTQAHNVTGGTYWVTEFADTTGNTASFSGLLSAIITTSWIDRYAYFTNRYPEGAAYIPPGWHDFALFDGDNLSPIGEIYAEVIQPPDQYHEVAHPNNKGGRSDWAQSKNLNRKLDK